MANAIEQSMEIVYAEKTYDIKNETELIADFLLNLCSQIESRGELEVSVMNVDYDNGLLDLKIQQHYKHFTGREGTVTCRRAVILESGKGFGE